MLGQASIPVSTASGDSIEMVVRNACADGTRVTLVEENDFLSAVEAERNGGVGMAETVDVLHLSPSDPSGVFTPPKAGNWRIVYSKDTAESVTAKVTRQVPKAD